MRKRRLLRVPLHPRLARLAVEAENLGVARDGATLAALLGERDVRLETPTRFGAGGVSAHASDVLEPPELCTVVMHRRRLEGAAREA